MGGVSAVAALVGGATHLRSVLMIGAIGIFWSVVFALGAVVILGHRRLARRSAVGDLGHGTIAACTAKPLDSASEGGWGPLGVGSHGIVYEQAAQTRNAVFKVIPWQRVAALKVERAAVARRQLTVLLDDSTQLLWRVVDSDSLVLALSELRRQFESAAVDGSSRSATT